MGMISINRHRQTDFMALIRQMNGRANRQFICDKTT